MAKDSSVAPRERINIRYKPAIGDNKEQVELPLKMVFLGDYTLKGDNRPVEDRELVNVNKDNFNDVMRGHDLQLEIAVDNKLSEEADAGQMNVSLKLESLRDFTPEAIVRQTPELNRLLELREALVALKGPLGNVPAFRESIQGVLGDEEARERLRAEITRGLQRQANRRNPVGNTAARSAPPTIAAEFERRPAHG
ncbi:type VI secretion system contractile sheath small subunit [Rhizobium calliandrae]|uniref:Type VI secretion system contractile sheath small subunit n=1 Tax=Rhizobium calliandrae TaxID=1312182 RepID=A0ABT7KJQ7_9HYPH|nr:type VI secretion system contractile sheath small subunit [Rhizobium calliandrae]MDL2408868.1 type VI secretion system contractile sheath small subunit [Rhizobium calliandrae]